MKIRFVTLNIWEGGRLFDNVVRFIKRENPDILALQEVYDGKTSKFEKRFRTFEIFKKELGFSNSVFTPAFLDTQSIGDIEQGNAIFSKFPILIQKAIFFDKSYSKLNGENPENFELFPPILLYVTIALRNIKLDIFNIHGIWGLDGKDNERRLKMSTAIIDHIKNKSNIILAGDFNVKPNTKTIQNIEKHLKNVFKGELKTTFNIKRKKIVSGYATAVVDMVFVSRHINIVEHYSPQVDISDHLPLVCELEI